MAITRALGLAYVRVQVEDLDHLRSELFYNQFGLSTRIRQGNTLYLRGAGPEHHLRIAHRGEPRLLAIGFEADSDADLVRLSKEAPGASAVEEIGNNLLPATT